MPARKSATDDNLEVAAVDAPSPLPGKSVRSLEVVAAAIRERLAAGEHAEKIWEDLAVSQHVFRELVTHSYKMVGRGPEIFEYQEKMRIGELPG